MRTYIFTNTLWWNIFLDKMVDEYDVKDIEQEQNKDKDIKLIDVIKLIIDGNFEDDENGR